MNSVVHTVPGLKASAGGVAYSVPALCAALAREGRRTILVSQSPGGGIPDEAEIPAGPAVEVHLLPGYDWERLRVSFTPRLAHSLEEVFRQAAPCVAHDHGLWLHLNHVAAATARRLAVKRVVSPRGMLEDWSLSYRRLRKKMAWVAYQRSDLATAAAFSATSLREAESIRALGFEQPIAVIPNGIDVPEPAWQPRPASSPRTALFMSRLHPKKGLLDLVAAWSQAKLPGWRLVVAGPDEGGHRAVVEAAVARAGLAPSVLFTGAVEGAAKRDLLRSADLFLLPSRSENFGLVVGEALAHGVPAITTTGTPWEMLREENCGWHIATGVEPLAAALREAGSLSDTQRREMGLRGRAAVERHFSWRSAAAQHIALYDWLLGASPPPSCLFP